MDQKIVNLKKISAFLIKNFRMKVYPEPNGGTK